MKSIYCRVLLVSTIILSFFLAVFIFIPRTAVLPSQIFMWYRFVNANNCEDALDIGERCCSLSPENFTMLASNNFEDLSLAHLSRICLILSNSDTAPHVWFGFARRVFFEFCEHSKKPTYVDKLPLETKVYLTCIFTSNGRVFLAQQKEINKKLSNYLLSISTKNYINE